MNDLKSEVWNILKILEPTEKDLSPSELEMELKVRDAQRTPLSSALLRAILRKKWVLPKRSFEHEPESPYITIDFLAEMVVELYFGKRIKKKSLNTELVNLIKKVKSEIDNMYDVLKTIGFSGRDSRGIEEYRNAALKYFDENHEKFKYLKKEYLEDFSAYPIGFGQETRFKGKVLQKLFDDNGMGNLSERECTTLIRNIDHNR